jgi:hypothetical protein
MSRTDRGEKNLIIRNLTLDKELSMQLFNSHQDVLLPNHCYNNVFSMTHQHGHKFVTGEWKIAYGYWSIMDKLMARHCFILEGDTVIDPTYGFRTSGESEYIAFKVLEFGEYLDLLTEADGQPALYGAFWKLENELAQKVYEEENLMLIG